MKIRYSQGALIRTIRNHLAVAQVHERLHKWPLIRKRAAEAVPALKLALESIRQAKDLNKDPALRLLALAIRPGMEKGADEAINRLRTAIMGHKLDDKDHVISIEVARLRIEDIAKTMAGLNNPAVTERVTTRLQQLSELQNYVTEVHFQDFWDM